MKLLGIREAVSLLAASSIRLAAAFERIAHALERVATVEEARGPRVEQVGAPLPHPGPR